jgi:hypothetical protein
VAQSGISQARLQDDCLQRLKPLIPREVEVKRVDFSALGNYATYYVVSYGFTRELENGSRTAACTYRRDGQWVKDDAAVFRVKREIETSRRK